MVNKGVTMLEVNNVYQVYNGKANKCCCGCSGKYTTATQHKEFADKERGYVVDDANDETVRKIVNKILNSENTVKEGSYFYTIIGQRLYIAYVK
jgi:hypothetical protein